MNIRSLQPNRQRRHRGPGARVSQLATLPVFHKLQGADVIVTGGSEGAAWKAELVAASGARVHVYAEHLDPVFQALIDTPDTPGEFIWHRTGWTVEALEGKRIAICDAETDDEAEAFQAAAQAVGVPFNVIDKPEYCGFLFGSIVNRSPAVISISTDGAAPILGQAIRRRIETLIPPSMTQWASLAQRIRGAINDRLHPGQSRRAFWEMFVDRAFGPAPAKGAYDDLISAADRLQASQRSSTGKVTLVGAGPGDAELLTLKAVRALQSADVILFDDLVSDEVLELARREAKRMLVGKRGGRVSCKQDDINDTMVALAKAGKHVVRLKGGDPMIFGRAGEEIHRLQDDGIDVQVVPGITSALAMASQLGVSLTHRDHAQSVRFVTGHSRHGELPVDVDWAGLADRRTTTIFYMGGRTAAMISSRLMQEGLDPATPVVISQSGGKGGLLPLGGHAEHSGRWDGPDWLRASRAHRRWRCVFCT